MYMFIFFFLINEIASQITPILVGDWAYSNAISTDDEIIFFYKNKYIDGEEERGGIARYKFDLSKISDMVIAEFSSIEENIKIYKLNNNCFILLLKKEILIIEDSLVIKTIPQVSQTNYRDLCIISESKFLIFFPKSTNANIIYRLYDINSESDFNEESPTYKTFTTQKEYSNYNCENFLLSNNNYIFCLMSFQSNDNKDLLYYNILDASLNEIISEKELTDDTSVEELIQYIFMIKFSDTVVIALVAKYNEENENCGSNFICNSNLIAFEIMNENNNINIIKKQETNIEIYIGSQLIYLEKLSDKRIAIAYPDDNDLMKFNIKIFSYIDNVFNEIKTFSVESTNEYSINSLKIFNINSQIAITYCQENWEEEDEVGLTYFFYITIPKCQNFEIQANINTIKNIDFEKYILDNGLIEPEKKDYKIKIQSTNIELYYNEVNIILDNFYSYDKIFFNSGNKEGNFETIYYVFNENEYGDGHSCKILFNIKREGENDQGQLTNEIIEKINELKLNFEENAKNNILYESNNYQIHIYNTSIISKQKTKSNKDITYLDLNNCEKTLKEIYSIPEGEDLIILKVNLIRDDTKSSQVEYEVYSSSLNKLNLEKCINDKIIVSIPYNLNDDLLKKVELGQKSGYDILNPKSSFYNDICTPFISEYDTDISLEDRKKYYYSPELLCENNCEYSAYNIYNLKVNCQCKIKTSMNFDISNNNFVSIELNSDFNKEMNNINFKVFKCLKEGFQNFAKNAAAWLFLILIISYIICLLMIFIFGPKYMNINETFKNEIIKDIKMVENLKKNKENKNTEGIKKTDLNNIIIEEEKASETKSRNVFIYTKNSKSIDNKTKNKHSLQNNNIIQNDEKLEEIDKNEINNINNYITEEIFTELEINEMSYKLCLNYDKRNYIETYISLLKHNQLIFFTFVLKEKHNLFFFKILIFEFFISLLFLINMFLFTDNDISYYYKNYGTYNFGYEIPKILASSLICIILNMGIKLLMYNQKIIEKIKESNFYGIEKDLINGTLNKFFYIYNLKIKLFSIISFAVLLIFFFYVVSFGSVFNKSQKYFCSRVILSFIVSMIYSAIISSLSSFLRVYGLKNKKKCLYNSSIFIHYL